MSRYNLIDEPWIPVRDLNGRLADMGIKDVLLRSRQLASIQDPSPCTGRSRARPTSNMRNASSAMGFPPTRSSTIWSTGGADSSSSMRSTRLDRCRRFPPMRRNLGPN